MSYQVLARKYRPQSFDDVAGQEHVTTTLSNAILKKRLHHAYLFTGARGIGKTSLARIFAKSLNCEKGPTPTPCNQCSNCDSITRGNFLDVIEIDGASNTSVESVRELREQVKYMPASGRYKVYIIDEVHMLSTSAFNALLKTLEEPPAHVLFIFATTEAHKIPVTILSRCQRFDLRRLSQSLIGQRLSKICREEKINFDKTSLELLAKSADGSMRDAQSLLDMAIGLCGETLQAEKITEMLGFVEASLLESLSLDCLTGQLAQALTKAEQIYQQGLDLNHIATQWLEYFHDLILLKAAGVAALGERYSADQVQRMQAIIQSAELDALQIAFQTIYRAAEEIFRSESPKILFDILLVKLTHGTPYQSLTALMTGAAPIGASDSNTRSQASTVSPEKTPLKEATTASPPSIPQSPAPPDKISPHPKALENSHAAESLQFSAEYGEDLIDKALQRRPQIKALLAHALWKKWEGQKYIVAFEKKSLWEEMFIEKRLSLAEALSQELNVPIQVELRSEEPSPNAEPQGSALGPVLPLDPVVQQAIEIFNATIHEVKHYGHE